MAKIYDLSAWREAKNIAKSFKRTEIQQEVESLQAYIHIRNKDKRIDECESLNNRLSIWQLALRLLKNLTK